MLYYLAALLSGDRRDWGLLELGKEMTSEARLRSVIRVAAMVGVSCLIIVLLKFPPPSDPDWLFAFCTLLVLSVVSTAMALKISAMLASREKSVIS